MKHGPALTIAIALFLTIAGFASVNRLRVPTLQRPVVLRASQVTASGKHPTLLLTPTRKAALAAKRQANHPDYVALKTYVDASAPAWIGNYSSLAANLSPSATTLTVLDGAVLPTSGLLVRIDFELISCASRSGNTLAGCTRGGTPTDFGIATVAASHPAGTVVWQHQPGADYVNLTPMAALLVQLSVPGYETKARGVLSTLAMYTMAGNLYQNGNYVRWFVPGLALGYDWNYANLTAREKSIYADALGVIARDHLTPEHCGYCAKETYAVEVVKRETAIQTAIYGNIANGELQAVLMAAAATMGDNLDAPAQWAAAMRKVRSWLVPAITNGVASGGSSPEGTEYSAESYVQTLNIFSIIESATGDSTYAREVQDYAAAVARFLIYSTLPGTVKSLETTTGSISRGSSAMTVTSSADFKVGQLIRVTLDVAPWIMETAIVGISGSTFSLRDRAIASATAQRVTHIHRELTWGDATENPSYVYGDSIVADGHVAAAYHALDILKSSDSQTAGYIRFWLDNIVGDPTVALSGKFLRFLYDDSTVEARDYTATLPPIWASPSSRSAGMLIGRSDWSPTATLVHFLVGGEMYDHTHSHFNSYQIRRGGVWLSNELYGYDVRPYPGVFQPLIGEAKYLGARYHNTLLMNGHGGNNGRILATEKTTPAVVTRSELTSEYMYGRGDTSGQYSSSHWTEAGYPNNNARTYIRDFLYLKPDLVVFADMLAYSAATASPTTWIGRFTGDPSITGQRLTSTYAGQKIVQDVVVPSDAKFTKINETTENSDLDDFDTQPHFRIESTSGATTAKEWSLQVIQLMDSAAPPSSVRSLTTVNANVAQVGNYVIGAVKADSPILNVSYSYTGAPTHYLMGFAPNTPYHVINSASTVTVSEATGAGDQNSTAAGLLIFPVKPADLARVQSPPPSPTSLQIIK